LTDWVVAWLSDNALVSINVVTLGLRPVNAWTGDRMRPGKPSRM